MGELTLGQEQLVCSLCNVTYRLIDGIPVFRTTATETLLIESDYGSRDRTRELSEGYYASERELLKCWITLYGLRGPTLDIGCGNGLLAPALPDYLGLEYSLPALMDKGWTSEGRVCGDAQLLPLASSTFGMIVSVNAFEHIPRVDQVYAELERVLAPGGMLLLKPAWHSLKAYTEAIPIRPYSDLTLRQKIAKATLPIALSRPYKLLTRIPPRMVRRWTTRGPQPMNWRPLTPYPHPHGAYSLPKWLPDTDAASSIDPHETMLYFTRRGYKCLSHRSAFRQIIAGHDWVLLRKPA